VRENAKSPHRGPWEVCEGWSSKTGSLDPPTTRRSRHRLERVNRVLEIFSGTTSGGLHFENLMRLHQNNVVCSFHDDGDTGAPTLPSGSPERSAGSTI
jgi:hypothetical protein